jgi:hypothetical protein
MNIELMDISKANNVYDLLVSIGGAEESERSGFIYHHCTSKDGCDEWRFCGKLGFGGKYRSQRNRVDCYKEDETPLRIGLITKLNSELEKINK